MNLLESTAIDAGKNLAPALAQGAALHPVRASRTCGEVLVTLLENYGVDLVFGIPGVHTVELYRGLAGSALRHISPRHEQGAGFMADGYARVTGRPGVCLIITGPGMTNIATAMAQAYADSIPMLVISSVNARHQLGSGNGNLHELMSQRNIFSGITAFSHTLMCVEDLPLVLARAFAVFDSARPRPVHIEIPLDIAVAPADHLPTWISARSSRPCAASDGIADIAKLLLGAKRPLILAGGGAVAAGCELQQLAEYLHAPTALTINAKGLLPAGHPLLLGSTQSSEATRALVCEADVVLAIGTELSETDYDTVFDGGFRIPGQLIRIDIEAAQLARNFQAAKALMSDARDALKKLMQKFSDAPALVGGDPTWGHARVALLREEFLAGLDDQARMHHRVLALIRDTLPESVFVGDSTQVVYTGNLTFDALAPRTWFNSSTGFGTLGYALPAAIGAKLGREGLPVVCLIGDGGLQFTLPELASAVEAHVPVIILLWNNLGYGEIKKYMESRDITPIGVDIYTPDFIAIAQGFGCRAHHVSGRKELVAALRAATQVNVPTVIEISETEWIKQDN